MKRFSTVIVAVVSVCLVSGCGGLLLALAFKAVTVGALMGQINDLFGKKSTDYTLLVDGYDLGVHPDPTGALNLSGLPAGQHLLSVVTTDRTLGFSQVVNVEDNTPVNLGQINLIQGATISGNVARETSGGPVPLADVRVAAIKGGTSLVAQGGGSQIVLPPTTGETVVMGMTDDQGNFVLGPCAFGDWLVTTATAGLTADATFVTVQGGVNAANQNLVLQTDATVATGLVHGTVAVQGGAAIASALVNLVLSTPLQPSIDPTRLATLQSQTGVTFMPQPWFRWSSLATQTDGSGSYSLQAPAGDQSIYGFEYGYRAQIANITVTAGGELPVDITLTGF